MWEEHPEAMGPALARHDTIIREAVANANGRVVKSTGDGMLAVFDTATDATAAGIAAQLGLHIEEWPVEPLRVRMGIHVGSGEARDGDVYGADVNRAARVMAAAHGGQVLLSGAAAAAARLPDGSALRDLGVHRLKDLTHPERLHQVLAQGLDADFPAPATLDAVANNLPIQVSEFFGREQELATVQLMLEAPATRLVTLTGPGGTGKTRLSLQAAAQLIDSFPDGVFFIDVAADTDPAAAYESMTRALGYAVSGGSTLQILKTRLRDQRMLLVIDNLEQVTEAASGLVELIQSCPDIKLLVTSRAALRVRAEQVYPVPPLALPHPDGTPAEIADTEAVQLFVERARAVRPDFAITDENARTIAEICLRLDGLPLAIELAAARLNVLSSRELMDRLRGRLDVLASSHRDLPQRQRTLWGAIGWSYELLSPGECRLFEMLSVFSPTDLTAIEAVASRLGIPDAFELIASLVDKSLVRSVEMEGSRQFSMLQTIREFASELLVESEDGPVVRRAHAEYFCDEAAAKGTAGARDLLGQIGNLQTAWDFWIDTGDVDRVVALVDPLWAAHDTAGAYSAAIRVADEAVRALGDSSEHSLRSLSLRMARARAMVSMYGWTVEVDASFRSVAEALTTVDPEHRTPFLPQLATFYLTGGDMETSLQLGTDMIALAATIDDAQFQGHAHYVFGLAVAFTGDSATGLEHLDRAIHLFPVDQARRELHPGPSKAVTARVVTGLLRWELGHFAAGRAAVAGAVELAAEMRHPITHAYSLWHAGYLDLLRSRFEPAIERAHQLGSVARDHDYPLWRTLASVLEGVATTSAGRVDEGLTLTEVAVDLYRGLTAPPIFWPLIQGLRGSVFMLAGRHHQALEVLDDGLAIAGDAVDVGTQLRITRGNTLRAAGDIAAAAQSYREAADHAARYELRAFQLQSLNRLVDLHRSAGHSPDGTDELAALYAWFDDDPDEHDLRVAAELLG